MLKYLITTSEQLIYAALLIGLLLAYLHVTYAEKGKSMVKAGAITGAVIALVMAYVKNATSLINTGSWNIGIFSVTLAALILFFLFTALGKRLGKALAVLPVLMAAIIIAMQLFYALPDVLAYPYIIYTSEKTLLSTTFINKVIGIVFGLILCFVAALAINRVGRRLERRLLLLLNSIVLVLNSIRQITTALSTLLARRIIPSNHTLFVIAKYAANFSNWFIYAALAVTLAVPVILWIRSFHVNEPYANSAQKRKILAKWRNIRRWSTTFAVCAVLVVLNMTVINAYANKEVELSPIEDAASQDDENMYVAFDQVNDGHLHRFGYTTEDGTVIRFIIIQKPNSSAYGVGLDACDICGETGYYEKDSQVVCNLCDVVMNINTIGFKGGCNPIVIDYSVANGYIVVPIEGLVENESEFK